MKTNLWKLIFSFSLLIGTTTASGQVEYKAPALPSIQNKNFNIIDFGAKNDNSTDNAVAIQSAIDAAAREGGGHVIIPAGDYLSGPLTFKNNIDLHLEANAVLRLLPIERYPGGLLAADNFINGYNLHDVSLTGQGKIDGQGSPWWPHYKEKGVKRPIMINLKGCERVLVQGLTLADSPKFHIAITAEDVTVQGVTVRAPASDDAKNPSHNTDACNVSGHHILVENCDISTGDDNYTCAGNTSDVMIRNNKYGFGHGVSIGSYTSGGVKNFTVENCTFDNTEAGIRVKTDRDRGGVVENLVYRNLKMNNVGIPILLYQSYNIPDKMYRNLQKLTGDIAQTYPSQPVGKTTPKYRNILFQNIVATVVDGKRAGLIWGLPESLIENIVFENVNIRAANSFGIYFSQDVQFNKCKIITKDGLNRFDISQSSVTINGKKVK